MQSAQIPNTNPGLSVPVKTKTKPVRTPEETEKMKNQFFLAVNGYHIGEVEDTKLDKIHNYVLQGDGVYLIVNNPIGKFITKVQDQTFPGLPKQFNGTRIKLNVPKIPSKIYHQIVKFFTDISEEMGEAEAFCQVYYDKTKEEYEVVVPKQTVTKGSVQYDAASNLDNKDRDRYVLVFEIHSHNTMSAFWSGTDNADEKDTRFYGVLGELDHDVIAEKYRYMIQGKEIEIKKEHIFDFTEDLTVDKTALLNLINETDRLTIDDVEQLIYEDKEDRISYPKSWLENISKPTPTYNQREYSGHYKQNLGKYNEFGFSRNSNINKNHNSKQLSFFEDEFDEYDYKSWNESFNDDPERGMMMETIWQAFDLTELRDDDEIEVALDAISNTIEPLEVTTLIEKLVDNGHHGRIAEIMSK